MDHNARCGITSRGSLTAIPSQAHDSAMSVQGTGSASFSGFISLPASATIGGVTLGLGPTQSFPNPDAIAYVDDPVGAFTAGGKLLLSPYSSAITLAFEFDRGSGGSGASDAADVSYSNATYTTVQEALDALFADSHDNTILHGSGAPASDLGTTGDFYIDTTAYKIYGPKSGSSWGTGVSLVGPQGDKGDTGTTGSTGPQGVKGDTGDTGPQGVKGDTGTSGSKGDKGDIGATGSTGPQGDKGDTGLQGVKGDTGDVGPPGTDGATGPAGADGPKGDTGATGPAGADGTDGAKGDKGDTGATGPAGADGPKGDKGDTGATGPAGADGPKGDKGDTGSTGPTGADGKTVRSGSGVPSSGLGVDGDFYIDTTANTIYGPKTSGAWGSSTSIVGPMGATGSTGSTGSAGVDGKTVRSGSGVPSSGLGVDGDFYIDTTANAIYGPKTSGAWGSSTSIVGPTGSTGPTGAKGDKGDTGTTGSAGADGKTVRNGSGAPSSGLGNDGDFYIDTTASAVYGPKTTGAWGSPTTLIGLTGATGPAGSTGATGPGVPTGGTANQVLTKIDGTNYNTQWGGVIALPAGAANAPSIFWNTNDGFYSPTVGAIGFGTGGVERFRLTSAALQLSSIQSTPTAISLSTTAITPFFQANGTGNGGTSNLIARWSANAAPPALFFSKSRGAAVGTHGQVSLADPLGYLAFGGSDGTNFVDLGHIGVEVSGVPTSGVGSGRFFIELSNASGTPSRVFSVEADSTIKLNNQVRFRPSTTAQIMLGKLASTPSTALSSLVTGAYDKLSAAGLLTSKLLGLWVHSLPAQADGLLDWIGTHNLTITGTPVFTANKGFTGDGSTALLNCPVSLITLGSLQDSMSAGTYVLTASASAAAVIGMNNAQTRRTYLQSATSGALAVRCNDQTAGDTFTPSRYTGMFCITRNVSTGFTAGVDDIAAATITRTSVAQNAIPCFLGTTDLTGSEFSTAQIAFSFLGLGLSAADIANLRAIMVDYFLVGVGAITPTVANLPPALNFKGDTFYIGDLGGGGSLIQSDGTSWSRMGSSYEAQAADADKTLVSLTNAEHQNFTATITANRVVTLQTTDAKGTTVKKGARFIIRNSGSGAFTFTIKDGGGGTLLTVPVSTAKSALCLFDGTAWALMQDSAI